MRLHRKALFAFICAVLLLLLVWLGQLQSINAHALGYQTVPPKVSRCGSDNLTAAAKRWRIIDSKYKDLTGDKFTYVLRPNMRPLNVEMVVTEPNNSIALSTFRRPKELEHTLNALLSTKIPSLHEVVVVWNNLDQAPPQGFTSSYGVHVRYRVPIPNSLNEKLWPDPTYQTKAILLSDDDVYYRPSDLEYVFQMWREFGQERLVGALARCSSVDAQGEWRYHFCSRKGGNAGAYSIVLTNLAFAHVGFLDYYFSDSPEATQIREYVDAEFNCEDIALNVLASMLSRNGPLLVHGSKQWINLAPRRGISASPGHMEARSRCLNKFAAVVGCMPLVDEMGRVERGYKHNVWYKSFWDTIGYRVEVW